MHNGSQSFKKEGGGLGANILLFHRVQRGVHNDLEHCHNCNASEQHVHALHVGGYRIGNLPCVTPEGGGVEVELRSMMCACTVPACACMRGHQTLPRAIFVRQTSFSPKNNANRACVQCIGPPLRLPARLVSPHLPTARTASADPPRTSRCWVRGDDQSTSFVPPPPLPWSSNTSPPQ